MSFTKATAVKPYLKMAIYGAQGSGKTFTSLLFAEALAKLREKRIAFIDTEHGTKYYRAHVKERTAHPEPFDFDILETRSIAATWKAVSKLDPATHGVIVIDSVSHLWQSAIDAYVDRHGLKADQEIPLRAWSAIKKPYKRLIHFLSVESPFDTIVVGREKLLWKTNAEGKLEQCGVGMRAEGETPFEPDVLIRMSQLGKGGERSSVLLYGEKDRSGILAGRTIPNPTAEAIRPFFAYLGEDAVVVDDEEARTEADAELMESARTNKKAEKSKAHLAEFMTALTSSTTIEELGQVAAKIKKSTRSMLRSDVDTLIPLYEQIRTTLTAQQAGDI